MKNVLVTGGSGFIGSNFVRYLLKNTDYRIINYDALTYAGNEENLAGVAHHKHYHFVKGDICDGKQVQKVMSDFDIDTIVNFAAESHVDRSIENPLVFLETNVSGVGVLLDCAIKSWRKEPQNVYCREYREGVRFLQVSTDEVYGALGSEGFFTEDTPLCPNSPYSASKAAADMLVRAYHNTYGLPVNTTRCSNNYGPYQYPEKLIPLMIQHALDDKGLPIYGDGMQVRDWLHVEDHCSAILTVLNKGVIGEVYNVGGNNEKTNIDVVKIILESLAKPETLIEYVVDRPGHDRRYSIDNSKITRDLGWSPSYEFSSGLKSTIDWYLENTEWVEAILAKMEKS